MWTSVESTSLLALQKHRLEKKQKSVMMCILEEERDILM